MKQILTEIQDGSFAKRFLADQNSAARNSWPSAKPKPSTSGDRRQKASRRHAVSRSGYRGEVAKSR